MTRYVIRRLASTIPTLLAAFMIVFLLTRFVPGDPVRIILQEQASAETYEAVEKQLGLDKSVGEQLVASFTDLARFDLGTSFHNRRPVSDNISARILPTVYLTVGALIVSAIIGIPAGMIAARYRGRWPDFVSMIAALLSLCAPSFWLAILLIMLFSLKLGLLPTFGVGDSGDPLSIVKHLVLPSIALGTSAAGLVARVTRSAMLEVLSEDYVRTARAKGLSERVVVYKHALLNATIPITTIFGLEVITLLTGTVIIEKVFARQGLGQLLVDSILTRDYPQIQGVLLLFVFMATAVNLIVDLLYAYLDPRIRYS